MKTMGLKSKGGYLDRNSAIRPKVDVSIVIPLFNEEENIVELHAKLTDVLLKLNRDYEIIFVDDGSSDRSFSVLEEIHRWDEHVKAIQFRKNYGKAAALSVGFESAQGDVVVTLDADLQDDPQEIPKLMARLEEGYDLVSGWKFDRKDPWTKMVSSRLFNRVTSLFSGVKIHDFNCGLKAYRREVIEQIDIYGELHRYIPALAYWAGFRVGEVKVHHHPRMHGRTKYGISRFLNGFFDLLTVTFLTKYTKRPLHLFGIMGLISFILGMIINIYLTVLWFQGIGIGERPLLLLGVLLLIVGIQFISLGLLGEIITSQRRREGEYSIRKILT